MIFWRGWGILAFLAIGVSVGFTAIIAALTGTDMNGVTWQGIPAFFIVGTGLYFLGRQLNVTGPAKKLAFQVELHNAQVEAYDWSESDQNPGHLVSDQEEQALLKRMENRHTFFFIPMQWWGFLLPIIGIAITFASLNSSN